MTRFHVDKFIVLTLVIASACSSSNDGGEASGASTSSTDATSGSGGDATSGAGVTSGVGSPASSSGDTGVGGQPDASTVASATTGNGGSTTTTAASGSGGAGGTGGGETPTGDWPNEPANWNVLLDWAYDEMPSGDYVGLGGRITTDPDAPFSNPGVLECAYPMGFAGGVAPCEHYLPMTDRRELYVGYWWKVSNPWQGHPSQTNKISFLMGGSGSLTLMMYGAAEPYSLVAGVSFPEIANGHVAGSWGDEIGPRLFSGNVGSTAAVTLGEWHRVELYVKPSAETTSRDGIVRYWLDGGLVGDYTNVNFPADPWEDFLIDPIWGGLGSEKTQNDSFEFDHVRVSAP